jgi:hypothetical protein
MYVRGERRRERECVCDEDDPRRRLDVGGLAVGVGALTLAVLCTIWFFHDREGGLRYEESSAQRSAFRVRLDAVSPAGIAGTF